MKLDLLPAILLSVLFAQSSVADICADKKRDYGKRFISCSDVDWGGTPLSGDYQPSNFGPMTAPPSAIPGYVNDYPEVKRTIKDFNADVPGHPDQKGTSLAQKFVNAVSWDQSPDMDPTLVQWLAKDWSSSLQPPVDPKVKKPSGWEGKCEAWASSSMDPTLLALFGQMRDGIMCNGVPFTKGELKEIVTSLYPIPTMDRKDLTKFYNAENARADDLEDANVALSKLGMFGQGDIGPAGVLKLAKDAKDSHRNMMMDRDPGSEVWNQPIKKVTDIAYTDDSIQDWEVLTSAEFDPATGTADQTVFLDDLKKVETALTENLLKGNGVDTASLCRLKNKIGEQCDDLNANLTLSEQAAKLNHIKQSATAQNIIRKKPLNLVRHELIIEYGTENSFASNGPDKTIVQSYTYTAVNAANPDGSSGAVIRSAWTPRLSTLDDICASPALANGRNSTGMTNGFQLDKKCDQGKPADSAQGKKQFFTGAVPPNNFKTFTPLGPGFNPARTQKEKAYNKLLKFLAQCDRFDQAHDFLNDLNLAMADNVISAKESDDLAKEYSSVKKLLNLDYIQSILDKNSSTVQGLEALKARLGQN